MYIVNADQTLSRDTQLAVVSVPPSYTVGFEITPDSSTVASWGSIVHFTTDSDSGDGTTSTATTNTLLLRGYAAGSRGAKGWCSPGRRQRQRRLQNLYDQR